MNDPRSISLELEDDQASAPPSVSRRTLLAYAVTAPVLTMAVGFGVNLATPSTAAAAIPLALTPPDSVDYYDLADSLVQTSLPTMPLVTLTVATDGRVTLDLPRLESGQGLATACGILVAEELDVPLSMVSVTSADARPELVYNQITGGSSAVRVFDAGIPLIAGAARARLLLAAANQWGVASSSLRVNAGVVIAPDGRTATYGSLSVAASLLPVPTNIVRKPSSQFQIVGRPAGRLDARDIVTGKKKFTMDQDVPGAIPTMMRMPSQVRGTVVSVNNLGAVKGMPGVLEIVVIPPGGNISERQVGVAQ